MKNNSIIILLLSIFIIIGAINLIFINDKPIDTDNSLLGEIKNLEIKLDSLNNKKDSIRTVVFTVDKEIVKNEKHYEKIVDTIIANNDSSNFEWARNYIEKFVNERTR